QFRKTKDIFHQKNPNTKVGISWGGWQAGWDDPANGGGRSLFNHFADILQESDFTAFQAMESRKGVNTQDINVMTQVLSTYKNTMNIRNDLSPSGVIQIAQRL